MADDTHPDTRSHDVGEEDMDTDIHDETIDDGLHEKLTALDGVEFEQFIADLWEAMGWQTTVTQQTGDDGIDVVAKRDGIYPQKRLIQAKCVQAGVKISRSRVQKVSYLHTKPGVDEAVLVTTGTFTDGAKSSAERANVKLVNIDDLIALVRQYADPAALADQGYVPSEGLSDSGEQQPSHYRTPATLTSDPRTDVEGDPPYPDLTSQPDRLFSTLVGFLPGEMTIKTRLALLFQSVSGDPIDVAVVCGNDTSENAVGKTISEYRPTLEADCTHLDTETLYGRVNPTGRDHPGLLTAADPEVLWLRCFDEWNDYAGLREPLEGHTLIRGRSGEIVQKQVTVSLLLTMAPKYGAFDSYEPIREQIPISGALMQNVDILSIELGEQKPTLPDRLQLKPDQHCNEFAMSNEEFHSHLIQARNQTVKHPETAREALSTVRQYFDKNSVGREGNVRVPKNLGQVSEASARLRLGEEVGEKDIIYALMMMYPTSNLDPGEIGHLWADLLDEPLATLGIPAHPESDQDLSQSQDDRLKDLHSLIVSIEKKYDEGAPVDVVIERAETDRRNPASVEHDIDQLKQKGELYEPQTGYLRTT